MAVRAPAVAALVLALLPPPAWAQAADPAPEAVADPAAPAAQPAPEAAPGAAEAEVGADAVFDALRLGEVIAVMAEEGQQHGDALAAPLFEAGAPPASWTGLVDELYDPERLEAVVRERLAGALEGEDAGAIVAFMTADPGRRFVEMEIAARRALIDEDRERAANEAAAVAMAGDDPRLDLLRRYAEANDLVELNVASALNTNVAYLMGLLDGGAMGPEATEADVVADVRAEEAAIRARTTEWVYSFLLEAYAPASDADLEALIAFSETAGGRALNRALFGAFDGVFEDISRALGLASARHMATTEI